MVTTKTTKGMWKIFESSEPLWTLCCHKHSGSRAATAKTANSYVATVVDVALEECICTIKHIQCC